MKRGRRYLVYDVFTDTRLAGNQLAVVLDSQGLDTDAMQAITREFNLSETVFVTAEPAAHTPIRIFTPAHELPFAGHPTVGTAIALTELDTVADNDNLEGDARILVLDEKIGPIRCVVTREDGCGFAEFALARLPAPVELKIDPAGAAAALGLDLQDIGFENHKVSVYNAGLPYAFVPVHDIAAASRAKFDPKIWLELIGGSTDSSSPAVYLYCRETSDKANDFHARMFAGHIGIPEDPATGSAVAAFAGAVMHFDQPVDGTSELWIEQGVEMGRPSRIKLSLDVSRGALTGARIGGFAVKVAEGTLFA